MNPIVDESREKFSWGTPDAESLREFAKIKFGWTKSKTDDILMPALKKIDEKKSQSSIRNYFQCQQVISNAPISVSKRVRSAINRMGAVQNEDENLGTSSVSAEKPANPKRQRKKAKAAAGEDAIAASVNSDTTDAVADQPKMRATRRTRQSHKQNDHEDSKAATDEASSSKKIPKIPDLNPPIRQRVKDLERLEANKQKAIELLKKKKK